MHAFITKAFAFTSGSRADKAIRRNLDKDQKKLHVPRIDRTSLQPPPVVVAVVGPPGVMHSLTLVLIIRVGRQLLFDP